jgi:hypothetical protein
MTPATAMAAVPAPAVARAPVAGLPYKLLDYYKEGEAATFAGREDDVAEVVARAARERTFVLYGRSGLGKTSLILAGVFPQLRKRGFRPVHVRVLDTPLVDLRNAIAADLQRPSTENADDLETLLRATSRHNAAPAGVVLVLDQFEEFFIRQRKQPTVRRAFIQRIAELALDPHGAVQVVFSLREDYLAEMDDFRAGLPEVLANSYRLRPLTAFGARQAIIAPLVQAGIGYDQKLVTRLVDLLAEFDFDSLLLQIACSEVYREAANRHGEAHLTEADLDQVGGLDGLFRRYLDNAIKKVPQGQLLLARAVLDALITQEQTKRAVTLETLKQNQDFCASDKELDSVLGTLEQQRLLRREMRAGKLWYELSHERLVPRILEWFKRDTDFANFRDARDVITNAVRQQGFRQKLETLLHEGQIKELITPYRERLNLNPLEREFMFWSAVYRRLDDVDYWAHRFGYEHCAGVLQTLLQSEHAEARLGAARAAGLLVGKVDGLSSQLTTTALNDADEGVRRAAGRSLAAIAGPAEIDTIKQSLRSRKTRSRALAVLADFGAFAGPLAQFRRDWQFRARRRLRLRAFDQHREPIRKRAARGAIIGLATGFLWAITAGAVFMCVVNWLTGAADWASDVIKSIAWVTFAAGISGALLGWRCAREAARRAALRGEEGRWFSASAKMWSLPIIITALVITVLMSLAFFLYGLGFVAFAAGLWLAIALTGGYLRLARASIWPHARLASIAMWGWLLGVGPLSLLALVIVAFAGLVTEDPFVSGIAMTIATVGGLLATVMAVSFAETTSYMPIGSIPELSPRTRLLQRAGIVAATIAIVPIYFLLFGSTSIPPLAPKYTVSADKPENVEIHFSGVDPRASFVKVEPADPAGHWYRVTETPTLTSVSTFAGKLFKDDVLFLPPGHLLLVAQWVSISDVTLGLEPIAQLEPDQVLSLSDKERTVFLLKLSREGRDARWSATWTGRLPENTWKGRLEKAPFIPGASVGVSFPNGGRGREGTIRASTSGTRATTSEQISYVVAASLAQLTTGTVSNFQQLVKAPIDANGRFEFSVTFEANSAGAFPPSSIAIPVALKLDLPWESGQ